MATNFKFFQNFKIRYHERLAHSSYIISMSLIKTLKKKFKK
jgi:hypothetical protein